MNFIALTVDILLVISCLFVFLLVGKFLYSKFTVTFVHSFQRTYVEIALGFFTILIIYAIVVSGGKTILLPLFLLMLWQYFFLKVTPDTGFIKKITKADFLNIGILVVLLLTFFGIQLYRYDFFNSDYVKLGWLDYGYYSDLAENLNQYGLEQQPNWYHPFRDASVPDKFNPTPYHYFEVWTQSLLMAFSNTKGIYTYLYIYTPFISMFVAGAFLLLAITFCFNKVGKRYWILILASFVFTFFIGKLPFKAGGYEDNVIHYPRVFGFYLCLILFIVFYKLNFKKVGIFFIAFIAFFNILYAPTIIGCLFLYGFYLFLIKKDRSLAKHALLIAVGVSVLIFGFYNVLFKSSTAFSLDMDRLHSVKEYILFGVKYYFRLTLMRIWFFYLPLSIFVLYFLIQYFRDKKRRADYFEIVFIALLLELVSLFFASFFPHLESGTFNSIVANPLLSVLSFMALLFLINNNKLLIEKLLLLFLSVQAIYCVLFVVLSLGEVPYVGREKIGKEFLKELSVQKIPNKSGAFLLDESLFKTSIFYNNASMSKYSSVFDVVDNGFTQVSLSAQISEDSIFYNEIKGYVKFSPMYQYGSQKLLKDPSLSRDSINIQFIKDYKIDYLVIQPETSIPKYLIPYVDKTLTDKYSKLQIAFLKIDPLQIPVK